MEAQQSRQTNRGETNASIGALASNLVQHVTALVSDEAQLAKTEMSSKIGQITSGIGSIAAAGAVLMCGFLVLLAAAVFGLNRVLPPALTPWLSALIVGLVVVVIGVIMLVVGRKKLQASNLMPQRAIASFRRDSEMVQQHRDTSQQQSQNGRQQSSNGYAKEQTQ